MPAVHAAHGVGLHGKRQVLVHAAVGPPDALRVGVARCEWTGALEAAEAEAAGRELFLHDLRAGPFVGADIVEQSPTPEMVRARDHAWAHALRHPGLVHEVADARRRAR